MKNSTINIAGSKKINMITSSMFLLWKTKKWFVIIFLILCNHSIQAQRGWKDYLVTGSAMFVSGMLDGTVETLVNHYQYGFKDKFHGANDQFWNPKVSWRNKYKNHDESQGPSFSGSTDMFVAVTDGYHLLRTTKQMVDVATLAYYVSKPNCERKAEKRTWKTVATDFIILSAIRSIGFHVTYSVIFKQNDPGRLN